MLTVLLLSGGLDSAVCLARYRPAWALAVDYGQPHSKKELACAARLARAYGAKFCMSSVGMPSAPADGDSSMLWPGRNLVLLSLAAALAQQVCAGEVMIGANADDRDGYPDCRPEFFRAAMPALGVRIMTPLLHLTKPEIGAMARDLAVPIAETWSCYFPDEALSCGQCDACIGRERALA